MRRLATPHRWMTLSGAVLGGVVLAGLLAGPAAAHVSVSPTEAKQGGYAKLTFRVPNERDNANTTAVEINIPPTAPIASVSVKPLAGWTAEVTKGKLPTPVKTDDGELTEGVLKIVWTATPDAAIKAGQFQEFDLSAGPLPAVDQIVFKALQTYSSGEVVRWIDEPSAGEEAEHPAPVMKLTRVDASAPAADQPGTAVSSASPAGNDSTRAAGNSSTSGSGAALGVAIAALVIAVAGLLLGLLGVVRQRKPQST